MLPDHVLSSTTIPAPFLPPDDRDPESLVDYEFGGVAIRDASQGLRVKVWTFRLTGDDVTAEAIESPAETLFTRAGITLVRGCFDQNMNPCVAFEDADGMWLWWFDTTVSAQVFTQFDGEQPKVCMDDKRSTQGAANDIILAYLRDGFLYFRGQRDRFTVEYPLADVTGYTFTKMGMNTVLRLQFQFDPIPEAA